MKFLPSDNPPSPAACKFECVTESSICGFFGKCNHIKQLDILATRRTTTINKRASVYNIQSIDKTIIKQLIFESIKNDFKCSYCNEIMEFYSSKNDFRLAVSIDHIIPLASDGNNNKSNLLICCTRCNLVKGTMKEKHFKLFLKTLQETGGQKEVLEWLDDAYQHALAYKIERLKVEWVN